MILWFTGLSGAGKTTLAKAVYNRLSNKKSEFIDGDDIRQHFCKGLTYSKEDRLENVLRISYVANLLAYHKVMVLVAAIAPYQESRQEARVSAELLGITFVEVFVNASLATCEKRDPKGLYRKARIGKLKNFTGIDSDYEIPECPEIQCNTDKESIEFSTAKVINYLRVLTPEMEYAI